MTDPFDGDVEVAELYAARLREWSKWEASQEIWHGNARAHNAGDPVPQSNVDRLGYARNGLVRLQAAWVESNPDDADVKTFLAWAKEHPEHPNVVAWQSYRSQRAEVATAAEADNPFADTATPVAPARTARRATATTADKE